MDQKCASDICTLFEKLIRFQCYHLLRYGIKLKMTGSPGQTLPLICMLKDMLVDILSNTGLYLVVLGQNRALLVASVIWFQKIYGLHGLNHQTVFRYQQC